MHPDPVNSVVFTRASSDGLRSLGDAARELGPEVSSEFVEAALALRNTGELVANVLAEGVPVERAFALSKTQVLTSTLRVLAALDLASRISSLRALLDSMPSQHRAILEAMRGEHIEAVLEDVDAALEGFVAVGRLIEEARDEPKVEDLNAFAREGLTRQAYVIVGLEVLDVIAEGEPVRHGLAVPVAAFMAQTAREQFDAFGRALGRESEPAFDVTELESVDESTWQPDPETVDALRKRMG